MYVYKIIHILQEYTHTKTYTSPNLKGCFQEVEEMEQQMTSSKQSEGGKRKKKYKTGWQKKKKRRQPAMERILPWSAESFEFKC